MRQYVISPRLSRYMGHNPVKARPDSSSGVAQAGTARTGASQRSACMRYAPRQGQGPGGSGMLHRPRSVQEDRGQSTWGRGRTDPNSFSTSPISSASVVDGSASAMRDSRSNTAMPPRAFSSTESGPGKASELSNSETISAFMPRLFFSAAALIRSCRSSGIEIVTCAWLGMGSLGMRVP